MRFACIIATAAATAILTATPAMAHVSEGAIIMLLPTDVYTVSGVTAVVLTVLILLALPPERTFALFKSVGIRVPGFDRPASLARIAALLCLLAIIRSGWTGSRDPLESPMPLAIWTVWWLILFPVQAILFDIWRWTNPFGGLAGILERLLPARPPMRLPETLGATPALLGLVAFAIFYLADIAPDDPSRLAMLTAAYLACTGLAMAVFGPRTWLERGETFTVLMNQLASVAFLVRGRDGLRLGMSGHAIFHAPALSLSLALVGMVLLAAGSFDGINETFVWLGLIGVNPLEFPGRSAVQTQNVIGLLFAILLLAGVVTGAVALGLALAGETGRFRETLGRQARTLLPIAAGYHIAHYLTVFLVNIQYLREVVLHPFHGEDSNGHLEVTTGFLNTTDSVRAIFLIQAGAIVIGHMVAVMAAHAIASEMFSDRRKAMLSQLPLILLMIGYTLLGLWLLATPRGA